MATKFFNPADPFGIATGTGAKWATQNQNPTTTQDRAQWLKANGDEGGKQLHNAKTTVTATYVATDAAATIPAFGEIKNGWHIDNVSVTYSNTGFAQMSLTGHKHGSSAHAACHTYTGSLATIGTLFGCPAAPVGCTIPANAGIRSVNYVLTGNHIDELGSAGEWLGADNYDGNETSTVELCDSGTLTEADGWDATSVGNTEGNTQAETASGTFVKHIAGQDAP